MPRFDGTGPAGQGPISGRGFGICRNYRQKKAFDPELVGDGYGIGFGFRFGRRNFQRIKKNRLWIAEKPSSGLVQRMKNRMNFLEESAREINQQLDCLRAELENFYSGETSVSSRGENNNEENNK